MKRPANTIVRPDTPEVERRSPERRGRAVLRTAGATVAVAGLISVAFVAGRASLDEVADSTGAVGVAPVGELTWTVGQERVGRSLTFVGQIKATTVPGPLANTDGVVTDVAITEGGTVAAGDPLLSVQLRPVVAGQGAIPAFRDLKAGDRGADVQQLRTFLCDAGRLLECDPNDKFTSAMTKAVNDWHVELGLAKDGTVKTGDILWFEELPARVRPATTLAVGAKLAGTDRPITVDAGAPLMEVIVTREQAALVPVGSLVTFGDGGEGIVIDVGPNTAATTDQAAGAEASFRLTVGNRADGGPVCESTDACAALLGGRTSVPVELAIEVVAAQEGAGVPIGAIRTDAGGDAYVTLVDGREVAVVVLGASGGIAIVDGVSIGDELRLAAGTATPND